MSPAKFATVFFVLFMASIAIAEEKEKKEERTKEQCVDDMINWCDESRNSSGITMISNSYGIYANNVRKSYQVACIKDISGTNCTRDGQFWFRCSPSGVVTYKTVELKKGSTEGVDDEVCETRHGVDKLGFKFNKTAFDDSMDIFRKNMDRFNNNMKDFGKKMTKMTTGMFGNIWPFNKRPSVYYNTDDDIMK